MFKISQLSLWPKKDTVVTFAQADDWSARELSHEGSEMHLANGHAPLALQNDVDSSGDTESEEEEAEAAQQPMHTAAPSQPNGIAQQFMNGHAQHHSEAQLRQVSDSSKSEEEGEAEEEDAAEPTQVHAITTCIVLGIASLVLCGITNQTVLSHNRCIPESTAVVYILEETQGCH